MSADVYELQWKTEINFVASVNLWGIHRFEDCMLK